MSVFNKIKIIILILIFINISLLSQESQFHIQRMITDYKGVVSNGNKTICYGNYGIITFTTNSGKTWEQNSFGDKYNIMKIETDGSDFFGVTDYFLFRSYNNASYWLKQPVFEDDKIVDMTLQNNNIYILYTDGILKSYKDMNIIKTPLLKLNSDYKYSELKTDGINLYFIGDSRLLFRYNLFNHNLDSINLLNEFKSYNCTNVSGLKIHKDNLYAQISYQASDNNYYYSIIKSSDNGNKWKKLTNFILNGNCYKVIEENIYFLRTNLKYDSTESFLATQFFKIDSSHYNIDSTYFTIINLNDNIKRYIRWRKNVLYNDFNFINEDTIIAVGSNKLISVSYDGGHSFEFKSFFYDVYSGNYDNISILSDSLIFVINGFEFNKTTDGGATWLPQKYNNYNYNIYYNFPDIYYLDVNGRGFAKYRHINTNNDSNALVTNDYCENIIKTNDKNFNIPTYGTLFPKGLNLDNIVLFAINPRKDTNGNSSYSIIRYNKSLKFIDSTGLKGELKNIVRVKDSLIISLNLLTSGVNKADSNGNTINYSYNYFLLKSTDKGKTWDSINIDLPIRQKLIHFNDNYFYSDIIYNKAVSHNNYIFYPTTDKILYRYDYSNNKFDSLYLPANIYKHHPLAIFILNSKLFIVSNYNNKFFFTNTNNNIKNWDSLPPENIFPHWDNYNLLKNLENKDAILSANMLNDSSGFLIIGKSQKSLINGNLEFKINFAKIYADKKINVKENKIEENNVFLWNSAPFPIPGKNIIKSYIYWNRQYNIKDANINIYNILGIKINLPNVVINETSPYSGLLTWDCSVVNSGFYIIQIYLHNESISIPVIIKK